MSSQYVISFSQDSCVQCHGCEVACKNWRGVELGVKWRRVEHIWRGMYPKIKNISASVACMHCTDPVCAEACPEGAIKKRAEDGIVEIDREKCTGCQTCLEECPFDAPQFGIDGKMQKCDMCVNEIDFSKEGPPCVETCPTKALLFVRIGAQEKAGVEESILKLLTQVSYP